MTVTLLPVGVWEEEVTLIQKVKSAGAPYSLRPFTTAYTFRSSRSATYCRCRGSWNTNRHDSSNVGRTAEILWDRLKAVKKKKNTSDLTFWPWRSLWWSSRVRSGGGKSRPSSRLYGSPLSRGGNPESPDTFPTSAGSAVNIRNCIFSFCSEAFFIIFQNVNAF